MDKIKFKDVWLPTLLELSAYGLAWVFFDWKLALILFILKWNINLETFRKKW